MEVLTPASSESDTFLSVLLLPTGPLWKVQIGFRQKAAIRAKFSLTVLTMTLTIVRAGIGLRGAGDDDVWFFIYTNIELTIAILIT